jgi:hypothetical protein
MQGKVVDSPAWATATGVTTSAGWSNTVPVMSQSLITWTATSDTGTKIRCQAVVNFVFQDANGNRHNLDLTNYSDPGGTGPCTYDTADYPPGFDAIIALTGGEGPIQATIDSSWSASPTVTLTDGDGTGFSMPTTGSSTRIARSVSDRYGNTINITTGSPPTWLTYTDTAGRTVLQDSGFAISPETVTISGLGAPYTLNWASLSAPSFSTPIQTPVISGTNACSSPGFSWPSPSPNGVSTLTLPHGKSFTFQYDSVYKRVNKIIYPSGGYIRYVWGINPLAEYGQFTVSATTCTMYYGVPAVTDRYVSFDGSTEVFHQHFAYSTTWDTTNKQFWDSKQTIVTNYDLVRNTNWQVVYNYLPLSADSPPNTAGAPTS